MAENLCSFCKEAGAKYTCPRCQSPYCSLQCYQSPQHVSCSEDFYKDCVVQEMAVRGGKSVDKSSKLKMEEILRKIQMEESNATEELDSDDTQSEEDLAERLQGVDLDSPDAIWEKLTEAERREFESLVESGDIQKLIPEPEPWWTVKPNLVEDLEAAGNEKCVPAIKSDIQSLAAITKKRPADCVFFNLVNILYSYACAVRLYSLEWTSESPEAAKLILAVSDSLTRGLNHQTPSEALGSAQLAATTHPEVQLPADLSETVKRDVALIVKGPTANRRTEYVLAALSEVHRILSANVKNDFSVPAKDVKLAVKKIEYYLSLIKEYGTESLAGI